MTKKPTRIRCPACGREVTPVYFELWPGAGVYICPECRIGVGNLDKVMAAGEKKPEKPTPRKEKA